MADKGSRALQEYFDNLLLDGSLPEPEPLPAVPAPRIQPKPAPAETTFVGDELAALEQHKREKLQALLSSHALAISEPALEPPAPAAAEVAEPVFEPLPESVEATEEPGAAPPAPVPETPDEVAEAVSRYLEWHENGRPQWAQNRFDALLFDVAGLTLAVPLIALGQIHPLTDELTPLFGQENWFMGLLPTSAGQIRTINTALFVMPEKYDPAFIDKARYVVSIDGVPWGLAVDAIQQPISLDPGDVKWRTERGKRPWLAGTVKSAMCALIDIPQMGQMLMNADRNSRRAREARS